MPLTVTREVGQDVFRGQASFTRLVLGMHSHTSNEKKWSTTSEARESKGI